MTACRMVRAILAAMLLGSLAPAADEAELMVELSDGSLLIGELAVETLTLDCALGTVELTPAVFAGLLAPEGSATLTVWLANDDLLVGKLRHDTLPFRWAAGEATIPVATVRRISLAANNLDRYVIHGKMQGERTDFVKDIPEVVAAGWQRVTRTAGTSGPEASRWQSHPWLYTVPGKGETPRVFEENGQRFYPIWGTWKRHGPGCFVVWDENGQPISGEGRNPHYQTTVDYYVVPLAPGAPVQAATPSAKPVPFDPPPHIDWIPVE